MNDKNFKACIEFTLLRETGGRADGGYTKDPDDPGGETRWGISKRYHPNVEVKNLTREGAEEIYKREYWIASGAHELPWPYCLAVFDAAVIPGIGAVRTFIRAAEAKPGKSPFMKSLIVCDAREAYFKRKVAENPKKQKYIKGWLNRVNATRKELAKPGQ